MNLLALGPRRMPLGGTVLLLALLSVGLASGCGAGRARDGEGGGGHGQGAGSASGSSSTSGQGGGFFGGGLNTGGDPGSGGACAAESKKAEKLPLDMYVMFDQSGSMSDAVSQGTKWDAVTSALEAFVNQPAAVGIGVGLQYFPLTSGQSCPQTCNTDAECGQCGPCFKVIPNWPGVCFNAGEDSCDDKVYATPEVPIELLPAVAPKIVASLKGHAPTGGTPTSSALTGALMYATQWATAHTDHVTIVLLATDGDPTSCNTDLNYINGIAAKGVTSNPSIRTFVIGVGSSLTALNGIAAAGGTGQAFLVDTNQNVQQQFLDALNAIQGTALGCTYDIPMPEQGEPDYGKVNVVYTPGDGGAEQVFPKVPGKTSCPPNADGWYYDDNDNPTKILLCDFSCAKVSADAKGQLDIELGCATILN